MSTIETIREKVRDQAYEFTVPHFFEEMADDDLILADIEMAIANGRIWKRFTRDPRGYATRSLVQQPTAEKSRSFVE